MRAKQTPVISVTVAFVAGLTVAAYLWRVAELREFGPPATSVAWERNPADIGITAPNTLLDYIDWPDAPVHCRQPTTLLEKMRQAVLNAGTLGDAKSCGAAIGSDAGAGFPELKLTCSLTAPQNGCTEFYTAQIWVERERGSLVGYKVKGFGWLRRSCAGNDAVYETLNRNISRGTSVTLDTVLHDCRP